MKNSYTAAVAILAVFALLAGLALIQPTLAQSESKARIFEGELTKVDPDAKTLSVKNSSGVEMEFRYDEQTQIVGAEGSVEGLGTMSGSPVRVHFDSASKTATKIEIGARQ
jgi:NADH dehydrogenase FAD-containing subunit